MTDNLLNRDTLLSQPDSGPDVKETKTKLEEACKEMEEKKKKLLEKEGEDYEFDNVDLFLNQLKLIEYKDVPEHNFAEKSQRRTVFSKFEFGKEKLFLDFEIDYLNIEGEKDVTASLFCDKFAEKEDGLIWEWEDDKADFDEENAKRLFSSVDLSSNETKSLKENLRYLTEAMVEILEEKYGEKDKYAMDFGIDYDLLKEIFGEIPQ